MLPQMSEVRTPPPGLGHYILPHTTLFAIVPWGFSHVGCDAVKHTPYALYNSTHLLCLRVLHVDLQQYLGE